MASWPPSIVHRTASVGAVPGVRPGWECIMVGLPIWELTDRFSKPHWLGISTSAIILTPKWARSGASLELVRDRPPHGSRRSV